MKILVSDPLSEQGIKILKKQKGFEVDLKPKTPPEELKKIIKDYDALIVRSGTKVTKDIIKAADKLKVIGRAGVGIDNVDVAAASQKGIIVMNTPEGNTISTAEHTMSMILSLSRNIPQANNSLKQDKKWDRKTFMGVELYGKVLGVVGLGRVGKEVAKRCLSFGMKILAYDPFLLTEKAKEMEVELVDLNRLFKESDYITLHVPLTDETKHMISEKELAKMKNGVRIINCARGGIIDEKALYEALKKGKVAGAALDVYEKEPPLQSPLLELNNIITTPHLGAATKEAQLGVAVDVARQVVDALLGKGIRNAINIPSVEPEAYKILEPYIDLAEKLGSLQAQLAAGPITRINIKYHGDIISTDLAPVTVAVVKGVLTPILKERVNYVNATMIAKDRGIKVVESKSSEIEDFANLISVEAISEGHKSEIQGTLFTKNTPRIVKINEFYIDAVPTGYILVISNLDKPGIIGQIGTILGKNKINIAEMTFGREKAGGSAITFLNIDSAVPAKILKEIKSAKNIKDVKLVRL